MLAILQAIDVNADVSCNSRSSLPVSLAMTSLETSSRHLHDVSTLCSTPLIKSGTVSKRSGNLIFELQRGDKIQDPRECQDTFITIISECLVTGNNSGGESRIENDITYLVYLNTPGNYQSNFVRSPSSKKPAPAKPPPAKPAHAKPAPAKPNPAKPPPTPAKPAPPESPAKTIKIGPTKDCKQLALLMQTPSKKGRLIRDVEEDRGGFVGSRVSVEGWETHAKRAPGTDDDDDWDGPGVTVTQENHSGNPKPGTACEMIFNALNYPKAASMVCINSSKIPAVTNFAGSLQPAAAPYFSIDSSDNFCERIEFKETGTAILGASKYHIEHILEWQTVAKFFDWMNRKPDSVSRKFKDPGSTSKMTFCEYFGVHWKGPYPQDLTINGKTLSPIEHIAQAYPGVGNREEEFVWLQATINTPAKSNVSTTALLYTTHI
jgi:hypothetical protein